MNQSNPLRNPLFAIATNIKGSKLILILKVFLLFIPLSIHAEDFILINKIMYDTPLNEQIATGVAYSNGEYIELYNTGIDTINLSGWLLRGGGSSELYYFPTNTKMAPKSYLIVAYQYINSGFTLDQLYADLFAGNNHQIQYQRKILLSNSGESVYLRDNYGITRDSIYYDGNANKTKPNRLSADNLDGLVGNLCVCLQRKTAVFINNGCATPSNLEWATAKVNPFQLNAGYIQPVLPGVGVRFAYDLAGNRISRRLVTLDSGASFIKGQTPKDMPSPVEEQLGANKVIVYPNPTKGSLAVEITGETGNNVSIILYNAQGITLQNIHAESDLTRLEMTNYPIGWYILRVLIDGKMTEFKIVKQ